MLRHESNSDVIILGCGASGTAVFIKLIKDAIALGKTNFSVTIIEKSNTLGSGLPYQPEQSATLKVNDPALEMILIADKPDDFVQWVKMHAATLVAAYPQLKEAINNVVLDQERFPPRALFGIYCQQRLNDYIEIAKSHGIHVNIVKNTEITTMSEKPNHTWEVSSSEGKSWHGKNVVIATGHLPSAKYKTLKLHPHYLHSPWENLHEIPREATVAIMGTGLSSVDTAKLLKAQGHQGRIVMISPSGQLPVLKGPATQERYQLQYLTPQNLDQPGLTLNTVLQLFNKEIAAATGGKHVDFDKVVAGEYDNQAYLEEQIRLIETGQVRRWQFVIGKIWFEVLPLLWKHFNENDKAEFRQKYAPLFFKLGAGLPLSNGKELLELLSTRQLQIVSGQPSQFQFDAETGWQIMLDEEKIQADFVVNGTGTGHDLADSPLLSSMQTQEILHTTPGGGVDINSETMQVSNARGQSYPNLFALGPITFGCNLVAYSVEKSARDAVPIAARLMKNMHLANCLQPYRFFASTSTQNTFLPVEAKQSRVHANL